MSDDPLLGACAVQIIRGVPVERYDRLQLVILWWGIGQHIGRILPINRFGECVLSRAFTLSDTQICIKYTPAFTQL